MNKKILIFLKNDSSNYFFIIYEMCSLHISNFDYQFINICDFMVILNLLINFHKSSFFPSVISV